jgi:aconitate hydratase
MTNTFNTLTTFTLGGEAIHFFSLPALGRQFPGVARLPYSLKILLENLLLREDASFVKAERSGCTSYSARRR